MRNKKSKNNKCTVTKLCEKLKIHLIACHCSQASRQDSHNPLPPRGGGLANTQDKSGVSGTCTLKDTFFPTDIVVSTPQKATHIGTRIELGTGARLVPGGVCGGGGRPNRGGPTDNLPSPTPTPTYLTKWTKGTPGPSILTLTRGIIDR